MPDQRARRCLNPDMSVLVGTADPAGMPACCRGVGLRSADDLATVTVYVPVSTGQETVANVAATRRIAVVTAHPIDHCSIQLKGAASAARLARDDERDEIDRHSEHFGGILEHIGLPMRILETVATWPAFAIDVHVEEIYDQTPGPKAGARLR